jgi:hypothetical protein
VLDLLAAHGIQGGNQAMSEPEKLPWHYFLGEEGNREGWPRTSCEWFDGVRWRQCFENDNEPGSFNLKQKYRRRMAPKI